MSQNSQENTCAIAYLLNKIAGLKPVTLLKKRAWHRFFPVNFAKFLRTTFLIEHLQWLCLKLFLECQSIWYFNRNTIYSRTNIIFLSDARNSHEIKISFFHFLSSKKKISYFMEKRSTTFPDITKKIMFKCELFGKIIFLKYLKKTSYFQVFFEKDHLSFCV